MLWVCEAGAPGWGGKEGDGALGICMLSQGPQHPSRGTAALSCSHLKILLYFATSFWVSSMLLGVCSEAGSPSAVGRSALAKERGQVDKKTEATTLSPRLGCLPS